MVTSDNTTQAEQQATGRSFQEQFAELNTLLSAMGYQLVQYPELDGSVSLSGYDETANYIEFQDLTIFNIKEALDYTKRLFKVWDGLMSKQMRQVMPEITRRLQSLSPQDQETFIAGIEEMRASVARVEEAKFAEQMRTEEQEAQTAEALPSPQAPAPESDQLGAWESEGGNPHPHPKEVVADDD